VSRDIGIWVLALGGVLAAFGALRVYSVMFADASAKAEVTSGDGGIGLIVLVVGLVLLAVGWFLRRSQNPA
jgi:hypothetical protein